MSSLLLSELQDKVSSATSGQPLLVSTPHQTVLDEFIGWLRESIPPGQLSEFSDAGPITVKHARAIVQQTHHTAFHGSLTVLLTNAERLTPAAANTLLKALEEAPATIRFILCTRWPQQLLATIRSRAEQVHIALQHVPTYDAQARWPQAISDRLVKLSAKEGIAEDDLNMIVQGLSQQLRDHGPTPELQTAYQRLRDYYKLSGIPGSNRPIGDVLLASLPDPMAR